jgi:hypothetical protein
LASCRPHEIAGSCNPTPRKVSVDSAAITPPTVSALITITGAIALGSRCLRISRQPEAPRLRAEST